jgi:putative DNA primase/helicase
MVCCGDAQLAEYLQRLLGYLLHGRRPEQLFFIFHGKARNGKGVIINVLRAIFGNHMTEAQPDLLIKPHGGAKHLTELAELAGYRVVICSESEKKAKLYTSRVKALTGGDRIKARLTHRDGIEFRSDMQFILQTNHMPEIKDDDPAIWRRIKVVPFVAKISEAKERKGLEDELIRESPGILNWLIEGYFRYGEVGLKSCVPKAVVDATHAYFVGETSVIDWLESLRGDPIRVSSKRAHEIFCEWAKANGKKVATKNKLGRALTLNKVKKWRNGKKRGWVLPGV